MRTYTRVIFGLNTIYQLLLGLLAIGLPTMAIQMFGGDAAHQGDPLLHTAMRALGANIALAGILSAVITRDPDRYPILVPLMGLLSILVVVAEGTSLLVGESTAGQVLPDLVMQAAILVAVVGYRSAWTSSISAA